MTPVEIRHFHLFCGLGGGAKGFNQGEARVGQLEARFRCIGGVDVDPASIADFGRAAGVPGVLIDLFSRDQYRAFHGVELPDGWREATPQDIRRAAGGERPHIIFLSAPCKGFSGLLAQKVSATDKYQALNALTLRGVWLTLEAWADDPPELFVFENVPLIASRGRQLLDRIAALFAAAGYAWAETAHDCGEIGGLAQSRRRFLGVARHLEKVPPFLYEPPKRPLRGVGEVLERLPVPGPEPILPMHRVPRLQWKTWVRLAFVRAGGDWRSLNDLRVEDGQLADFAIAREAQWHAGVLGVRPWDAPGGTVTGRAGPTTGAHAVADPRVDGHPKSVQLGVRPWDRPSSVVTGKMMVGGGPYSVADPRHEGTPYNHVYRIVPWNAASPSVTSANGGTAAAVADPRAKGPYRGKGKYQVAAMDAPARTVISASTTGHGAFAVADPRAAAFGEGRSSYQTAGHYGVADWARPGYAVTAAGRHDNGRFSIADPRPATGEGVDGLPAPSKNLFAVIRALDGTWHRPFTTLELAALQGLVDPEEETLALEGQADASWRERIGNAVPPPAAKAIAGVMGRTLLLAWSGETFALANEPIWVRPVATALAVDQGDESHG